MQTIGRWKVIIVGLMLLETNAHAVEPVRVDELLTAPGRVRLDFGVTYSNLDQRNVQAGPSVLVQTGPAQFVSVPSTVGETRRNSDIAVGTSGLRYGVGADFELYGHFSALGEHTRLQGLDGSTSTHGAIRMADAWVGLNYQLLREGERPGLIVFGELALVENNATTGASLSAATSGLIGATVYRTIDPAILSATVAAVLHRSRTVHGQRRTPGQVFLVHPAASFVANDRITFSVGAQWLFRFADTLNGQTQGTSRTETDATAEVTYAWSPRLLLAVDGRANISGGGGADIGVTAVVKLGPLSARTPR